MLLPGTGAALLAAQLSLVSFSASAVDETTPPYTIPESEVIVSALDALIAREGLAGLAVAVIDKGEISHVSAHGVRDKANNLPLTPDTIMYGASFTKTLSTHMALQLRDKGQLPFDTPIAELLPKPLPAYDSWTLLKEDPEWADLTIRIITSHTTGLANLRFLEPDRDLKFHRTPGSQFGYSGEGYYILQTVVEEGLGLDFKALSKDLILDPLGMTNTSLQWRDDFAQNMADGFDLQGKQHPHDDRSNVSASGSMDTTIADQARFWRALVTGWGLSEDSFKDMITPQIAIRSKAQFPTLIEETSDKGPAVGLAAALGMITYLDQYLGQVVFKGGHNFMTGNQALCLPETKRCLVMMSNDVRSERFYPEIADLILGPNQIPWWWIYPGYFGD